MANWDCKEALNLKKMNKNIAKCVNKGVIFSGFACRDNWFDYKIDVQIHLQIDEKTCYIRRQEQRKDHSNYGQIIVGELIYPFYQQTLKFSKIQYSIDANKKTDKTLEQLIDNLIDFFERC